MPKTTIEIWWNEPDDKRYLNKGNIFDAIRGRLHNTFVTINGTPILEQSEQTEIEIAEVTVNIWWVAGKAMVNSGVVSAALHKYFGGLPTFHVTEIQDLVQPQTDKHQLDLGL